MHKSSLSWLLGAVVAVGAVAAEPTLPSLDRFVKPLGLTAEQQQKLKPVFAEAAAKMKAMSPEEAAALRPEREGEFRSRVAAVLKPDQLAEYDRLTAARPTETPVVQPAHGHRVMNEASAPARQPDASMEPPTK